MRSSELFVAELNGKNVFDPTGDFVGTIDDILLSITNEKSGKAIGFIVEVPGKRKVYLPITRVTSMDHNGIIMNGLLNMRRFSQKSHETLGFSEFLDRIVNHEEQKWKIRDFSISNKIKMDWIIEKLFLEKIVVDKKGREKNGFTKLFKPSGETTFVKYLELELEKDKNKQVQDTQRTVQEMKEMKPADAAEALLDLDKKQQEKVSKELTIEDLADVLEEMDEDDQIKILKSFQDSEIVEILEEMEPDDAVDLLGKMPRRKALELLEKIDEETADDLKQLLSYDKNSAGGIMTTNPVIIEADDTVAFALAKISREELSPSLASIVFVARSPIDTPTGRFLGLLHFQQLLRIPPHNKVGEFVDEDVPIIHPHFSIDQVARLFATYDAVILPVLDKSKHLLGAISVDDVIDHMLPQNWRDDE